MSTTSAENPRLAQMAEPGLRKFLVFLLGDEEEDHSGHVESPPLSWGWEIWGRVGGGTERGEEGFQPGLTCLGQWAGGTQGA